MADVELDVTFETLNNQVSANFGTVYVIDNGVAVKIIADKYSNTNTYEVGDYVIDNDLLYKCIIAVEEPEEFDPEKWSSVKLANDVKNKADKTYVDEELDKKADKTNTYTKTEVNTIANGKMDKANPTGTGSLSLNRRPNEPVGAHSTALGYYNVASGKNSTAIGDNAEAYGESSTAVGAYVIANGIYQFVFGAGNIPDNNNKFIEIVGNGFIFTPSNARTLDWDGNETLAGNLTFNGNTSLTSEISRLDGRIDNLPNPMIFKGTLGVGGTIQSLPTASASNEGWTYKVITAGTYQSIVCKVGDVLTSNGSEWILIPAGDEDSDTWRALKVNGIEVLSNGISSGAVDFDDTENVKFHFNSTDNTITVTLNGIYTQTQVDSLLENKAKAPTVITGTLVAGQTSVTLQSSDIDDNSTISVYTTDGTEWNSMTVTTGQVVITFYAQTSDLGVRVEVT